ncbi:MAG: DUF2975 domain-containing protein [Sphingobacteriaceae bacterium]|nr:MAG: DUF2975 domain-containing protein [Sphingobacteriaceae bacterium]
MKSYRTLNIILISTCLLMDFGVYFVYRYNDRPGSLFSKNTGLYDVAINKLKPIDTPISIDLPHSQFMELKYEQRRLRNLKNGDYNRTIRNFIGVIGVGRAQILCDTCHNGTSDFPLEKRYYYISLPGWKLRSTTSPVPALDSVIFHVKKFQTYIRKNVISTKIIDGDKLYKVEVKDIPVKFKYSHKSQMLKIPVSQKTTTILTYIFTPLNISLVLYTLFNVLMVIQLIMSLLGGSSFGISVWWKSVLAFIWFPFFIIWIILRLIKLSLGNSNTPIWNADEFAFTTYNIIRLRILAYSITGISVFFLLFNMAMPFVFNGYFTSDVILNTAHLYPFWIAMHVGVAFFLILHVFMQGKALKDEQDLTV